MKKKKVIKTILIIIVILAALTGGVFLALLLNGTFSQKLASGKYYIQGNDKYKDAYIEVKGDQIQFYNIDLNDALGTVAIKRYEKVIAKKPDKKLSEEEFNSYFDYNKNFVDSPYTIEYIADGTNKLGTYKYYHFMSIGCIYSTFVIHYDSWEKTIDIVLDGNSLLTFKKK